MRSFSTDVDTLLLLMQTELNDSSLTRLQLYYDSRIFNYDYLSQTSAVHNQISTIENSMAFMDTLEICMLDSMRKVMMGSIAPLDESERAIPAYISLEEHMACGIGACLGCVCRTTKKDEHSQVHNARICTEGPVFLAEEVEI